MKILNKIMESHIIAARENLTTYRQDILEKHDIELDYDSAENYGVDSVKTVMEFISKMPYDQLKNGNSFNYYKAMRRTIKMNEYAYDYLTTSETELFLEQLLKKDIEPYLKYPDSEREERWFKDWYLGPKYLEFQNIGLNYIINTWYKENSNFEGEPTLIEVKQLKEVFPDTNQIFVCEEMKIIIMIEMIPVYSNKEIDVTVYADYENSPYFNKNYMTQDPKKREKYLNKLSKMGKKVGYNTLNEESLVHYISKKNRKYDLTSKWDLYGAKYSTRDDGSISEIINTLEDKALSEILSTYIIAPVEIMYKPFYSYVDPMFHKFNTTTPGGNHCEYEQMRTVKSTKKQLEERLSASEFITNYYDIDTSQKYDFSIDDSI